MAYGRHSYGGVAYAASDVADIPDQTDTILAVEVAFTTGALETPVWEPVTGDVRAWDSQRGRNRELERFQPGRATVVLSNRERQYDSVNADGPHFGNLKPMRRIRIRETFNGVTYPVFDGFADRWQLDYPGTGKDATATLVATDAFKIFARTDLGRSVYAREVEEDTPDLWWHLDENLDKFREGFALNAAVSGSARNGTFVDNPIVGRETIVVNDPGSSMHTATVTDLGAPVPRIPPKTGVFLANAALNILGSSTFTVEMWQRLDFGGVSDAIGWYVAIGASDDAHAACVYRDSAGDLTSGQYRFIVIASGGAQYGVETPAGSVLQGEVHHVVCTVETGGQMAIYLDGTRYVTQISGTTGTNINGVTRKTGGALSVAYDPLAANSGNRNWHGLTQEVAVYLTDLPAARITAHYSAGSAPWQADLPGARLQRVLDIAEWMATARELDTGAETLQSADISTHTVLEHSQKVAETEYGLLFINRAGNVRFIDKAGLAARTVGPDVYGDEPGEIGYRDLVPDDGDETIRNRAIISRLNGVAKTNVSPTSIDEFGRFDYVLEGLLHQSDTWSQDYADAIVLAHQLPRRRVTSLTLGPPIDGEEGDVYPAMLGHELGDYITVRHRPLGGGALFTQACVIEGIRHAGTPKVRTTTWTLSPAPEGVDPVPLALLQAEDGDPLETEAGDEIEVDG